MLENIILITATGLFVYALYKWIWLNHDYFEKRGIPYLKPYPIVGNSFGLVSRQYNMYEFIQFIYNASTSKIVGLFDCRTPVYIVRDPEVLKQLTIKDFDYFEDHNSFIDESTDRMFGNSLFMLKGEKWRDMRATLSPAFTGSKMRQMFELVTQCAVDVAQYFNKKATENGNKVHVELKDLFSKYTNDVIASTAFGVKINSQRDPDNEFFTTGKLFLKLSSPLANFKFFLLRTFPKMMKFFDIELTSKKVTAFFCSMVFDNIKIRQEKGIFRPDMINLLMHVKKGEIETISDSRREDDNSSDGFATVEESAVGKKRVKRNWTDDEIVAQCFLFFVAGFDSASSGLTFLSYELAINPDIQSKLYKEIFDTNQSLNGQVITYDCLQKMKYMDLVVTESLRLWPPGAVSDRICVKDYNYDDGNLKFTIKKGQAFWIPIYGIHRDPKYFINPNKFDPERFNDENKNSIIPGSYIPFGIGPRNCIGSRFALMELKAIIYYLLLNFEIVPHAGTQIPIKLMKTSIGLQFEKGVNFELKLRT